MWLGFFKECIVSLIFQGINLRILSTATLICFPCLPVKGRNFSTTSKTQPNKDIATTECAVKDLEKEETEMIHAKISLTIQNSKHSR